MKNFDLERAHQFSMLNREQVLSSEICGCFYCKKTFPPSLIKEWTDDEQTSLCPKCGIDSVLGSASGFPVSDSDFLRQMHKRWF